MGYYATDKKRSRIFTLKLNYFTDTELIDKLLSVDNVQGYIKQLICADIEKNREKKDGKAVDNQSND